MEVLNLESLNLENLDSYQDISCSTLFGNPIRIGYICPECKEIHYDPGETIECFKVYFYRRLYSDTVFLLSVQRLLYKKFLVCDCKSTPCHGDVILNYLSFLSR